MAVSLTLDIRTPDGGTLPNGGLVTVRYDRTVSASDMIVPDPASSPVTIAQGVDRTVEIPYASDDPAVDPASQGFGLVVTARWRQGANLQSWSKTYGLTLADGDSPNLSDLGLLVPEGTPNLVQGPRGPAGGVAGNSTVAGYVTGAGDTQAALDARYVGQGQQIISAKTYGVKADGATDDTAAWVNALTAANGRAVLHPGGTSVVASATRLALTGNGTGIIGSPFGSTLKFTNAAGGLDIGDGTNNIYETTLRDITIHGGATATTVVRCRNMYEPLFDNVQIISAATSSGSTLLQMDNCGQLDGRRLVLSTAPIGLKLTGTTFPVINVDLANFYALTECIRVAGSGIARLRLTGWTEACPDVITVNAPSTAVSIGELTLDHLRVLNTTGNQTLFRAVAASGIGSQVVDFDSCYIDAQSSTAPLIDFTAFANPSAFFLRMRDCIPLLNQTTPPVLVQVNASQSWPIFHVTMSGIMATDLYYPTDKWAENPMATGGVWLAPLQLQGANTPEGTVAAPPGSTFQRIDGGDLAVYTKAAGTGNTGWFALAVAGSATIEAPITAVSTDAINNDFGMNILQVERSPAETTDPSTVVFGVNGAAQARVGYDGADSQGVFLAQTSGHVMQYGPAGIGVLAGTSISFYAYSASNRVEVAQGVFGLPVFATASRPSAATAGQGATIFDSTVGKPVYSDGTNWKTYDGTVA